MSNFMTTFENTAAKVAARLPTFLAQEFTLGVSTLGSRTLGSKLGEWYARNHYYKFPVGETVVFKWPEAALVAGQGVAVEKNVVVGHENDPLRGDLYIVRTKDGRKERHYKWNVENTYKRAAQPSA